MPNLDQISCRFHCWRSNTYMSESIPLSSTLCVERICIVECNILEDGLDLMLELFTAKRGGFWHVHGKTGSTESAKKVLGQYLMAFTDSSRIISPVRISATDCLTRCGVRRFSLPSYLKRQYCHTRDSFDIEHQPDRLCPKPMLLPRVHQVTSGGLE